MIRPRPALSWLFITLLVPAAASSQRSAAAITGEQIFEAVAVREGGTVCEIGAGDGELSIAAARRVGPTGRVYTNELGGNRVKALRANVAASTLTQITVVDGAPGTTNFPDGACDAVFMRDVYHHFTEPALMNASIAAALKPGGRVAIVDFTPPGREADRAADRASDGMHGVSAASVSREMHDAGFERVSSDEPGQRWFIVVVAKPLPKCPEERTGQK